MHGQEHFAYVWNLSGEKGQSQPQGQEQTCENQFFSGIHFFFPPEIKKTIIGLLFVKAIPSWYSYGKISLRGEPASAGG
jgi:hypothetical protein